MSQLKVILLTREEVVEEIKAKMGGESQSAFSIRMGVAESLLNHVLTGRRSPGKLLLKKLGMKKVLRYQRIG